MLKYSGPKTDVRTQLRTSLRTSSRACLQPSSRAKLSTRLALAFWLSMSALPAVYICSLFDTCVSVGSLPYSNDSAAALTPAVETKTVASGALKPVVGFFKSVSDFLRPLPVMAQSSVFNDGPPPGVFAGPSSDVGNITITPPPPPTPAPTPTPTVTPPPVIPFVPPTVPFRPGVVVPVDVTNLTYSGAAYNPANMLPSNPALNGIQKLNEGAFPRHEPHEDNDGGILVKWRPETIFVRPQNNVVNLTSGEVLISVKAPAKQANLNTPIGKVALVANSDILASFNNGIFRVKNVDGCGLKVKIKMDGGALFSNKPYVVSVAPGYEFTAANHKLSRVEMRPRDGIARRFVKVLEQGQMSIGEFYLAGAMASNELLVDLRQSVNGLKERRVISDMSKMAAVLNYQMGTTGFVIDGKEDGSRLASGPVKPIN